MAVLGLQAEVIGLGLLVGAELKVVQLVLGPEVPLVVLLPVVLRLEGHVQVEGEIGQRADELFQFVSEVDRRRKGQEAEQGRRVVVVADEGLAGTEVAQPPFEAAQAKKGRES